MHIKFSVIIPTYNRLNELVLTINSVLRQTYKNFEIIIVDNDSQDGTEDYCLKMQNKYDFITYKRQKNSGSPAKGRNQGIDLSSGDWICFLDSDDIWYEKKLEWLKDKIAENPDVVLITHRMYWEYNKKISSEHTRIRKPRFLHYKLLFFGNFIINSATSIKTDIICDIGLIDEREEYFGVEDFEYFLRISKEYSNPNNYLFSNEIIGIVTENSTPFLKLDQQNNNLLNVFSFYLNKLDSMFLLKKLFLLNSISQCYYNNSIGYLLRNNKAISLHFLFLSMIYNPFNVKNIKVIFGLIIK